MNPAAPGDFVTRASFGAIRNLAGEHVVMLLFAAKVEEVLGRLAGQSRFFLEFPKRSVRAIFSTLEDPAR